MRTICTDDGRKVEIADRRTYRGIIWETGEIGFFQINGFWVAGSQKVSSYERVDKEDNCQYSRSKDNIFYTETVG